MQCYCNYTAGIVNTFLFPAQNAKKTCLKPFDWGYFDVGIF